MSESRGVLLAVVLGGAALTAACGPTYPKCDNDEHCSEKGEVCVNGLCQQCRDNSQCEGAGMMCAGGKCQRRPGYCDESVPCPGSQKCRDNQCGPECLDNSECKDGLICLRGTCSEKPECGEGADNPACPDGKECISGKCQIKIGQCGGGDPVYFDYDRYNVKPNQKAKLDTVATCLKGENVGNVTLEGHCDERGTDEYNLHLGEQRAESTKKYLTSKGVPAGKLSTTSMGENRPAVEGSNESAWSKNRRVEFTR